MDDKFGGPAFPITIQNHGSESVTGFTGEEVKPGTFSTYSGMNLRDYFAAKAMQSILALGEAYDYEGGTPVDQLPRHAYALADAMLAERAK